jgi:hypothetical protein
MSNISYNRRWDHVVSLTLVLCLIVAMLNSCTPRRSVANWQNLDKPRELWSEDIGDCRRHARREMERRAGIAASDSTIDPMSGNSAYNQSINRYELQRFQQETFDHCMKRRGYIPIVK